jgi:predicted permease
LPILDLLGRDLRYACRRMWQTPGFSATVILTLAITIGAATAVFSLADAVLLRALPLPQPDRLAVLSLRRTSSQGDYTGPSVDGAMWTTARTRATLIDAAVSQRGALGVNFVAGTTPSFVQNQTVGDGYFRVLGVIPARGREFLPEEARPGGPAVAILSHQFAERVFAESGAAIGRTILLRGEPHSVVGVMPRGFQGLADADVWTPLRFAGQGLNYLVIARLRDGASLEAANAELASFGEAPFTMLRPLAAGATRTLVLRDLQGTLTAGAREPIVMLGWAVGAVLLIACVNITALLMARGGTRVKEIATRMALGGGRAAVIRQLMLESAVLALVGGAAGLLLAYAGLAGLQAMAGTTFAEWNSAELNLRALGACFALASLASLMVGVLPAWQTSRIDVQIALNEGASRSVAGSSRNAVRRALVVVEVALGVIVLVAAVLLLEQFVALRSLDPGFSGANLYSVRASLQDARYREAAVVHRLFTSSIERLRRTPGIQAAAVSQGLPYERLLNMGFRVEGRADEDQAPIANVSYVTSGFFETFGIRVLEGRGVEERDRDGATPVAVVNQAFARFYFPHQSGVGRRLVFGRTAIEIVGVSHDVQQGGAGFFLRDMRRGPVSTSPTIYLPAGQSAGLFTAFAPVWTVRAGSASEAAAALSQAIGEADSLLPIGPVRALSQVEAAAVAMPRLLTILVGALALTALLLAAIGIHGLITHIVTERRREFGIRLALGATTGQMMAVVVRSGVVLAAIGAVGGIALSIPSVKIIKSFLYTVRPGDPRTYLAVGGLLLLVACLSAVLPALRILRLDPARTLRD